MQEEISFRFNELKYQPARHPQHLPPPSILQTKEKLATISAVPLETI